ncbi:MAG TPA: hemerythrin domain-containing protein [Burkholderiaceae bacterium]|nr:hemerythrin domain-containing protein [Burkholderiaceae bacterium]
MAASGRFAVGIASIDTLHEECELALAGLADALRPGATREQCAAALLSLQEHLMRHFAHEESLMAASAFPPGACHQREHASVLEVVVEVRRRHEAGDSDTAPRLAAALLEWFEIHAASMDAALALWLNGARDRVPAEPQPA